MRVLDPQMELQKVQVAQGRPAIPLLCPQKEPLQKGSLRVDPAESSALRSNSEQACPRAKALAGGQLGAQPLPGFLCGLS